MRAGGWQGGCRCVKALQGAGVKALADVVINHRCAQQQDANGIWNVFGGKLAWDATAARLPPPHPRNNY